VGFLVFEREAPRDLAAAIERAASQLGEQVAASSAAPTSLRVGDARLSMVARAATAADHDEATARAAACGAAGLDLLARRCARVHRVTREGGVPRDELVAQAALALALLGPVMPDDELTVYGVRGAQARLRAMGAAGSSR